MAGKSRRTTHRNVSGTKLHAVRDAKGRFKDIQTYKRAQGRTSDPRAREGGWPGRPVRLMPTSPWKGGVRRDAMPRYEFLCEKCKKPFELTMTISERAKAKPTCPKCKGTTVAPQLGGFVAQTTKKS
jgi:putative FmdB family regulatory protein